MIATLWPSLSSQFLFEFGTMFVIINPYGLSFIFLNHTMAVTDDERRSLARRISFNAFCVLVLSLFAGAPILHFFGLSVSALRVSGGLVVAAAGWSMLNEGIPDENQSRSTLSYGALSRMTLFPLTIPLTAGPGSIATAIALAANRPSWPLSSTLPYVVSIVVAAALSLIILHAYTYSSSMARLIGRSGTHTISRLSAFLLFCVGVQIMITGILDLARSII
ncbi:MarC family protein [Xanthobacter flavus]|uniref:MarC family protein n=1 Tax=Xanthobacter flavus TaxID=281 RepID=UPI0037268C92